MRTTLDLPDDLIKQVMAITNEKTKSGAIRIALEEIVKMEKRRKIQRFKGKLDLDIDLDLLRDRG